VLKELFTKNKEGIDFFFENVDLQQAETVFSVLQSCRGLIIITGVGKSGLVAKKMAATMTSTNTRAIYLSPVDALHGDLGIVSDSDVFVFLSKSGESDELLNLLPALRNKGVTLVGVVSNKKSRLAKACDHVIELPIKSELCPFDLAPTTSTTVQMIFGDIMAIGLMRKRNFSQDDFALNHPAGRIGKRITLKVRDLMLSEADIPLCKESDRLVDTLVELSNKRCGCVLIVNDNKLLLGIFTDGDLRRTLQENGAKALEMNMGEVMTKSPKTISSEELAVKALAVMEGFQKMEVTVLPVLDDEKKLVGLIKLHDIIQTGI